MTVGCVSSEAEAFTHNVSKKISQLAKVHYLMSADREERKLFKEILDREFMAHLKTAMKEHESKRMQVMNSLVKLRKDLINDSVLKYGQVYKGFKAKFADMFDRQSKKFDALFQELALLGKMLKDLKYPVFKALREFMQITDSIKFQKNKLGTDPEDESVLIRIREVET
jgi:predicted DNA binding CopG/RHH family protein